MGRMASVICLDVPSMSGIMRRSQLACHIKDCYYMQRSMCR